MQSQDTVGVSLLKLWSWAEANVKQIAIAFGVIVIVIGLVTFFQWKQNQKEIAAGNAFTQALVGNPQTADAGQVAESYLKVAGEYSGTKAAQRAQLQGAAMLFTTGKYADAQSQFQKFLDTHPDSQFAGQAALGVAASLDAQGQTNSALGAYQRVINAFADPLAADAAKFAIARIDEAQGKYSDALIFYQDVAQANRNSSLGSEAGMRALELKSKLPAMASTTNAPFKLSN
ncbi:MAG TPA: tetratricopeptide repeat protein [Verrucomicrobiae bacterium]|nr:tetratricopeptide repeat protein [Verrucomicrobiae bacterium]